MYLLLATLLCAAGADLPLVSPPLLPRPPRIDGDPADILAAGQTLAGFCVLGQGALAPQQPTVAVARDSAWLYVAARLPKPAGRMPLASVTERDGPVWTDDALEVFVAPRGPREPYYQFIVNARGTQWDSLGKDNSWNATWRCAVRARRQDEFWTVELAIPLKQMWAAAGDNRLWGFNVAWDCKTPGPVIITWAPVQRTLHDPAHFGILKFLDAPARVLGARAKVNLTAARVQFAATFDVPTGAVATWSFGRPGQLKQLKRIRCTRNTVLWRAALAKSKLGLPADAGDYVAVASLATAGEEVYRAIIPMRVPRVVEVTARKYVLRTKRIDAQINAALLTTRAKAARIRLTLRDAAGRSFAQTDARLDDRGQATARMDIRHVPAGRYKLHIAALDPAGQVLHEDDVDDVIIPKRPEWMGNREGITDKVLPPWTPLKVSGCSVMPWGRKYTWGALPFPEQVETRGAAILAGPMRLVATINGRQQAWLGGPPTVTKRTPARVEFTTRAEGQDASVRGRLWCEYDGCVRCDWQIVGKSPSAKLERLVFEIPLKAQYAKLYYFYPGRWRSAFNAGAVPPEGMTLGYKPYVWLGDEWRGLAWFCPSDQAFRVADRSRMVEVRRDGERVVLRVCMVEQPVSLERPFSTTFGFEATPIRPNPEDVWDYRIIHTGRYGLEKRTYAPVGTIKWDADGNINAGQGTLEAWVRPHFDPNPPVKPDDPARGRFNRNFFLFSFGGYTVGFYWNIDDRGMRVYVRTPSGKYPIVFGARNNWRAGEWHHVALSWGRELRIYCDGKLLAKRPWDKLWGAVPDNLRGGFIQIGGSQCDMDVDELCISDIQRQPRGHAGPLKPDAHTLLLETFDRFDVKPSGTTTVPAKAATPGHVFGRVPLVDGRFGKAARFWVPDDQKIPVLKAYQDFGVRTICFHEHWSRIQNYFAPADPDGLRRLVRACHAHNIRLLVYYGYELSNIAPEWECCRDEILIYPRGGGYHRQPEQRCYICCYNSVWQDYLAWAIARTMDEFDMDGVYLDGTANPHRCANLGHGCGYVGADGKPHVTYPFFAVRQMMKRIYTIVKTRKPHGLVNVHQSTCMTIPSVGWATSYWDGEQFGSIARTPDTWPLDILPLAAFRAEFMGHQWGVPAELLCYERPYTFYEALAITLPHDVLVRPHESELELISKIWKAAEQFGRHQARWLPYWQNAEYVKVNDDDVKCSIYWREGKGALVVVSNLGREPVDARVWLKWRKLALPARCHAYDVVDQVTTTCDRGRLRFTLQPLAFKLIWLRP